MNNRISVAMTSAVALLLYGCSSLNTYNTASPYTSPRVGTMIELKQELSVRGGQRIYLQYGFQKRFADVDKQEPYCQFYVLRTADELRQPVTIEPDTFIVHEVFRRKDSVAVEGVQVAMGEKEIDHGSSQRTMSTYLELTSDRQPNVTRLICSRWADPAKRYHVSVDEIVSSLGDVAQLVPPDR